MKSSEVIETLNGAINQAKKAGVAAVPINALEEFSKNLEGITAASPEGVSVDEASMEAYRAKLTATINSLQQEHEGNLEMLRATITAGQSALKSALLINGGAAVAVLAFVGHIWSDTGSSASVPGVALGLALFVWGVLSAACASGATYLSQAGYGGNFGSRGEFVGLAGTCLAIGFVLVAYLLFALGTWQAYAAISS